MTKIYRFIIILLELASAIMSLIILCKDDNTFLDSLMIFVLIASSMVVDDILENKKLNTSK